MWPSADRARRVGPEDGGVILVLESAGCAEERRCVTPLVGGAQFRPGRGTTLASSAPSTWRPGREEVRDVVGLHLQWGAVCREAGWSGSSGPTRVIQLELSDVCRVRGRVGAGPGGPGQ